MGKAKSSFERGKWTWVKFIIEKNLKFKFMIIKRYVVDPKISEILLTKAWLKPRN